MSVELICPAGTPSALRAAVQAGAHAVYCGFRNETNARNFPGLNFSPEEMADGISFAHARGAKILVAINTFPRAGDTSKWIAAVETASALGADAVILADVGLLDYAARKHPNLRLHLSVQAAASTPEAIGFYSRAFGVRRVVLPRVLSLQEIARLNAAVDVETEVFVFGGLCVMTEGRCSLSSYATAKSPNMTGVCSPPSHVTYSEMSDGRMISKLGDFTINRFAPGEAAGYPTLCKGRFSAGDVEGYIFEDPVSLNVIEMLPELVRAGVTAFKIEGRQRGRAYIERVVSEFRRALDAMETGKAPDVSVLRSLTEGQQETSGAYRKIWR